MTAPDPDLVDLQVPCEQVRLGDLLVDPEHGGSVRSIILDDPRPDRVQLFTTTEVPLTRGQLVKVKRSRLLIDTPTDPVTDPVAALHAQLDGVRDLALAIADGTNTAAQRAKVTAAADKVRGKGKP